MALRPQRRRAWFETLGHRVNFYAQSFLYGTDQRSHNHVHHHTALNALQERLPKIIPTRTRSDRLRPRKLSGGWHCSATGATPRAATAALLTGTFVLVESLFTAYHLGTNPMIAFETHGKMDANSAASSLLMPKLFGFEGTGAATILKANAFMEAMG